MKDLYIVSKVRYNAYDGFDSYDAYCYLDGDDPDDLKTLYDMVLKDYPNNRKSKDKIRYPDTQEGHRALLDAIIFQSPLDEELVIEKVKHISILGGK